MYQKVFQDHLQCHFNNEVWPTFVSLIFYCFYLSCTACVISNYRRSFMKLHYVVLCSVLYVTQGIYLYNIESIKNMWNSCKIIRASNSTMWHLTVRIDSQGYAKYKVFFVLSVFRNLKTKILMNKCSTYFILSVRNFYFESRIHSKYIWFKVLILGVNMAKMYTHYRWRQSDYIF